MHKAMPEAATSAWSALLGAMKRKWKEITCSHVLRSWGYSYSCRKCGGQWKAH